MDDEQIVAALRAVSAASSPVEVAEVLNGLLGGQLTQGALVTYFKRAFPATPLRALLEAGGWSRVAGGGVTDEQFNEMLKAWIPASGN
jgi:hypothetical protein